MNTLRCYDDYGNGIFVPTELITSGVAVYGVFVENGRVLLLHNNKNNLWQLPGGILLNNERPSRAVRHHLRQIMGIMPELGELLLLEEQCRSNKNGRNTQLSVMYYALHRPAALAITLPEQEKELRPEFIKIASITRQHLQFGYNAVRVASNQ